jgi:hypothetical protein
MLDEMNPRAVIGANNPPDPIDTALAPHGDTIDEAANWLDGVPVETEAQMLTVDALIKAMKAARKDLDAARDGCTKPLNEAWKAEIARWKPTQDDLDLQIAGLIALVDGFKRQLAKEKETARRAAWDLAEATRKEAEAKIAAAGAGNIEQQREAAAAVAAADLARAQASAAQRDTVKGLRWHEMHEVLDYSAAVNWIARNDKDAMRAFVDTYAAKNATRFPAAAVRNWKEQRAA